MFAFGADNDSYSFANMTGAVKFTFTDVPLPEVKFVFTSTGKKMSGSFPLTGLADGASHVSWAVTDAAGEDERSITFYAPVESGEVSFYVPYPTGTLPAGCRVRLMDVDDSFVLFDKETVSEIEIKKNRITIVSPQAMETPSTTDTETFTESAAEYTNPERGFYDHNSLVYSPSLNPVALAASSDENSLVLIFFHIGGFKAADHIAAASLDAMRSVFADVRAKGKKAIVRFTYTVDDKADATPARVLNHIADLKPVLTENVDVIYVVQAGFIGRWGEWQKDNSNNFSFTVSGSTVTGFDNYKSVADALLDAVPQSRQVALRTPYYKRYYLSPASIGKWSPITAWDGTDPNSRFSFHDDGFAGNQWHVGTWGDASATSVDKLMWYSQSAYLAVGGETASETDSWQPEAAYYAKDVALQAISDQHMSYLNGDTGNYIMEKWIDAGCAEEIRQALGYRLSLTESSIGWSSLTAGSALTVSYTLQNSGAAPVINRRPMKLVLLRSGDTTPVPLIDNMGDVRTVSPGGSKEFLKMCSLPVDVAPGDRLAIWLPDAYPSIQDRAAYAIRLVNDAPAVEWLILPGANPSDPATGGYNAFYTF